MESAPIEAGKTITSITEIAAWVFFLLLAAVLVVATIRAMIRTRFNPFQWFLWVIAYSLCKLLWRTRWLNGLPLREGQGAIIICNHRSSVDPFFVQTATGRKVFWMVAREYCEHPALKWFLSSCEVIPVNLGGIDTAATKMAMRIVAEGGIVGMLPEGRINMTEKFMLPVRPGAALIALKSRVPLVPCYIKDSPYRGTVWSPFLTPARVEVRFGQPLDFSEFGESAGESGLAEEVMRQTLEALAALAGEHDFKPQMAGAKWKPTKEEVKAAVAAAETRRAAAQLATH